MADSTWVQAVKRDIARVTVTVERDDGRTENWVFDGRTADLDVELTAPSLLARLYDPTLVERASGMENINVAVSARLRATQRSIPGLPPHGEPAALAMYRPWPFEGDRVWVPARLGPDDPVAAEPGTVVSVDAEGWVMVDRGRYGQVGCSARDLRRA